MKKLLLATLGLFGIAYGQTTGYLRYDSVKLAKPGGYTELILENSTKSITGGVLTNTGNGRTAFVLPAAGSAWLLTGNTGTDTSVNWLGTNDAQDLLIKTNGIKRLLINRAGQIVQPDTLTWDLNDHDLTFYTNGKQVNFESDDPGDVVVHTHAVGDLSERLQIQADGHLEWGAGDGSGIDIGITRIKDGTLLIGGATNNTELYFLSGTNDTALVSFGEDAIGTRKGYMYYKSVGDEMGIVSPSAGGLKFILGSDATGDIYYRNSGGLFTRLGIGTAGQHLLGGTIPHWSDTATAGGSGANTALSNLASVAINSSLLPGTTNSIDLGSTSKVWNNLYVNLTAASIPFMGANGLLTQNNTEFFWDNTNKAQNIGSSYLVASSSLYSNYSSIGSLKNSASVIFGTGVKPDPGANDALIKTGFSGDSASWVKMIYNNGITFHTGYSASPGTTAIASSSNERMRIDNSGIVKMSAYGAGAATFDASGNISSVSDERLKTNIKFYKPGLKELLNLKPISYNWNEISKMETEHTYAGFSAQNVKANIPYGTGENKDGYLSLQDRAIMATLVNAVKELSAKVDEQASEIKKLKKRN